MIDREKFTENNKELVEAVKKLSKDERDCLWGVIRIYEEDTRPRYTCKRGDVVKFWSEWRDFSKGIVKDHIERIAIALDDCNNVYDSTMLEYLSPVGGNSKGCWRYEPVRGERFIEVIGHVDLSEWEAYTDKLWREVYPND